MTATPTESQALKARLLADLVQAMSSGHLLQATTVAVLVGRNAYDLVNQSMAGGSVRGTSADERLQRHLRNVVSVVSAAHRRFGDLLLAVHWYRNGPAGADAQQTPEAVTVAGRVEDVYRMLLATPPADA